MLKLEGRGTVGPRRGQCLAICLALAAMCFAVFGQTIGHSFINFDDNDYVYQNPVVSRGLAMSGLAWAFSFHASNWHPLTWISHMLDCQLYALNPAGHHLTNVLLHTAASILLFLLLSGMTGEFWPGAFVAAVFAIHPLRAESVAWVAERKDVLSGLFFVLTIAAYVRWVRQRAGTWYGLALILFALGLMAKPMLVSVPFVLLLLDWWPLKRTAVREKIPFFALSAASCLLTWKAQHALIQVNQTVSMPVRIENAVCACAIYLFQMVFPRHLAACYPFPLHGLPNWELALSSVLLVGLIALGVRQRKERPWIIFGLIWYLVMLAPVLGIVQVGSQAHADRYTYLPEIGIAISVAWTAAQWKLPRPAMGALMGAAIVPLMICAWAQTRYWRNSETLWSHTLACTTGNDVAEFALGNALLDNGDTDGAIDHYQRSIAINPRRAVVHYNLGSALLAQGKLNDATSEFAKALQINPHYEEAENNLGTALLQQGKIAQAIAHYRAAVQLRPGSAKARVNLGIALLRQGDADDAIEQFKTALQIEPASDSAQYNLSLALQQKNQVRR